MVKIKKHMIIVALTVALILFAVILIFVLHQNNAGTTGQIISEHKQTVKIAALLPLTGVRSEAGEYARRGIMIALSEIQSKPKNKFNYDVVFEDTQYDPRQAISAFTKVHDVDRIKYIVGGYGSGEVLAMAPLADASRTLLITPSAQASEISYLGDYIFRTQSNVAQEAPYWAEFLSGKNINVLCIVSINTDYPPSFIKPFKEKYSQLGGKISDEYVYDVKETDFKTLVLKLKQANAKSILFLGTPKQLGTVLIQSRLLGFSADYYPSSPIEGQELIKIASPITEKIIYPYPYDDNSVTINIKNYKEKYFNKYNSTPEMISANAYDSLNILYGCIESRGDNVDSVKQCIYDTKNYPGASGILTFDSNGDVIKPFIIKTIVNDSFVKYSE